MTGPYDIIMLIGDKTNETLNQAEYNLTEALQQLKGLGEKHGHSTEDTTDSSTTD